MRINVNTNVHTHTGVSTGMRNFQALFLVGTNFARTPSLKFVKINQNNECSNISGGGSKNGSNTLILCNNIRASISYTNVKIISINYKQYSCPVPTINVPGEICNDTLLKNSRYEEVDWMEIVISTD